MITGLRNGGGPLKFRLDSNGGHTIYRSIVKPPWALVSTRQVSPQTAVIWRTRNTSRCPSSSSSSIIVVIVVFRHHVEYNHSVFRRFYEFGFETSTREKNTPLVSVSFLLHTYFRPFLLKSLSSTTVCAYTRFVNTTFELVWFCIYLYCWPDRCCPACRCPII